MPKEAASSTINIVVLCLVFNLAFSHTIINTLPGYNATLPFKLETGYVSVGENDEVQLLYYFVESERNPVNDPLVLWHTGGPGNSAFNNLVFGIGPLSFDLEHFDGSLPSFVLNPYAWTKIANIIFLDSPVGTGFSYSTSAEGYYTSDTKTAKDTYTFLRKWLLKHPNFIKNRLYMAGDSYGGKTATLVATEITRGNEAGVKPHMTLKGYILGSPMMDPIQDAKLRILYAHGMALISHHHYKLAESSCNPDSENKQCLEALQLIETCLANINAKHILEPKCELAATRLVGLKSFPEDDFVGILLRSDTEEPWCRNYNYVPEYVWANDPIVQEALQIRNGSKEIWTRRNKTLAFEEDVEYVVPYHQYLSKRNYQVLIYSGDHDMVDTFMETLKSIQQLNLTLDEIWRPWSVNGQIAGYTEKYTENRFTLTFATVKGAGHTSVEYKPKECFAMINRWLSGYPL